MVCEQKLSGDMDDGEDGDLTMQPDYLWKELKDSYPAVLTVLQGADSVRQASDAVFLCYERPADQSEAVMVKHDGVRKG